MRRRIKGPDGRIGYPRTKHLNIPYLRSVPFTDASLHKIFTFLVFLLLLPTLSQGQQKGEVFESFIRTYSHDFAFQEARTVFPLKVYHTDEVPGRPQYDEVPKARWTPERILDTSNRKIVVTMVKRKDGTRGVRRAVADTGAQVLYIFKAIKGKWFLVKVVDESM